MTRRIVITGLGGVTPLGNNMTDIWASLIQGQSGIGPLTRFDATGFNIHCAGEVKNFDPEALFGRKEARRMDPFCQFSLAASQEAIADAGLTETKVDRTRVGTLIGSALGGVLTLLNQHDTLNKSGPRRVSPFLIPMMLPDTPAAQLAIEYGFMGPSMSVNSACATGTNALGEAFEMIARGAADVMIAGGADALIVPPLVAGFAVMKALSAYQGEPTEASRPFDATRDGFVISEGAATLVLEDLDHAQQRGAHIYAELIGYGTSVDAYHMVAPHETGEGAALAMKAALKRAHISPADVDYLNAHGTSTPLNDTSETTALKHVFGTHAYNLKISSTKSMSGHLLGAAGALEGLICAKVLETDTIPPTINYRTPDPTCDLNYTPNEVVYAPLTIAMSNSFGFGGHNASIILRKFSTT